jgi:hypothetical protein
MEFERTERCERRSEPASKRKYQTPELRRLGTVAELTLASGTNPATEPFTGITPKAST